MNKLHSLFFAFGKDGSIPCKIILCEEWRPYIKYHKPKQSLSIVGFSNFLVRKPIPALSCRKTLVSLVCNEIFYICTFLMFDSQVKHIPAPKFSSKFAQPKFWNLENDRTLYIQYQQHEKRSQMPRIIQHLKFFYIKNLYTWKTFYDAPTVRHSWRQLEFILWWFTTQPDLTFNSWKFHSYEYVVRQKFSFGTLLPMNSLSSMITIHYRPPAW